MNCELRSSVKAAEVMVLWYSCMKSLSHWITSKAMLVCPGKIWGIPSSTAGVPRSWNVSCGTLLGDWHSERSHTWKQHCWVLTQTVSSAGKCLEFLVVFWGVFPLLLLSSFFSVEILKLVLNKALTPQKILAFNSVYLSHGCLLLPLVTLKLVGPVLLSHFRLSCSVRIPLPSVSLSDFCCLETENQPSRLLWKMRRWSGSKSWNAGINDVSVQLDSGLTLLTYG